MSQYLVRRLITFIPTLFGISIIIFFVMHLIPGDTITAMIGTSFKLTEAQTAALRAYFGLDKPLPVQYLRWLWAALQGNFGYSARDALPVLPLILDHFPLTLELSVFSMAIALLLGVPLGIYAAVKRDTTIDLAARTFALVGLAMPNFWLGMLIILVLSLYLGLAPNAGNYVGFFVNPLANLKEMIFPAITLGFASTADVMRMVRSSMLEELGQDYARTARAKGLSERAVFLRHCLKNALIPVVTIVGLETGYLFCGAIIVESVYALPGIGWLLLNGITERDYPVIQGTILFISFCFVLVNLVTDLVYAWVDPRIRYE
ncbi:MAG: ABC transporter permease [Anaerolineales bacterium]|jgi:peptide/nickel transport system permease protein